MVSFDWRRKATLHGLAAGVCAIACLLPAFARAVGDVPSTTAYVTNGTVTSIVRTPDGSTIIGGSFTKVGPQTGGGLILSDSGNGDPAAATFPQVAGYVISVIPDGAGGWFIGGAFSAVGGVAVDNLAHILANGSVDPQWKPSPDQYVFTMALAGTNLFIGGNFNSVKGSSTQNYVAKIPTTGDGTADATWNPNPNQMVSALAVSATDVFIGGGFSTVNGSSHPYLVKVPISGSGTVDSSWNPNAQGSVSALALSGTDLFVGGSFTYFGGQYCPKLTKISITGNGTGDTSWHPGPNNPVTALAVSGTDVYFGGDFTSTYTTTNVTRNHLAKTSTTGNGAVDASWDPNLNDGVSSIAVSGGNLFISGSFTTVNGSTARAYVAKLSTTGTGTVDTTWNPNPAQFVYAVATAGSKVYVGGTFGAAGSLVQTRNNLAKLNPDGTLDPTWNPNIDGQISTMALSGTSLYFGGYFDTANGSTSRRNAAMTSITGNGTVDANWDPSPDSQVAAIAVSGTDVFLGGSFYSVKSTSVRNLAKVSATTGAVDQSWYPNVDGFVQAIAVSGTSLYIGGGFQYVGSTRRNRIAMVQTTGGGGVDARWDPNVEGSVSAIIISKSTVYFGGFITSVGGKAEFTGVARTATTGDGSPDPTWKPAPVGGVTALALAGPWLYMGGYFTKIGGLTRNGIARTLLGGKGIADASWDPNVLGGAVIAVGPTSTSVVIGGGFSGVHGQSASNYAQVALPVQSPAQLTATPATWDFLSRNVNTSATKSFTIANTGGGELTLPPGALTITGANAASFVLSNNTCEDTILIGAPYDGSSCTFDVTFLPTLPLGAKSAALNIADDSAGNPHTISLSGTASYPIEVTVEQPGTNCVNGGQQIEINPGDGTVSTTYVCNGGSTSGSDGASAHVSVTAETDGANCLHGGQKIETSIGTGPVVTSYVCNGADGAPGVDGLSPIVVAEGAGVNCQHGGLKITTGAVDQFVCNGAPGADGQDVTATTEAPGANCPAGGVKIVSADSTTYVCHGETALVKVTNEPAGEACPTGGQRIDSGLDKNANGVLDAGEITSTSYACNGVAGDSGHNSLVKTDAESAGANCAEGGTKISAGIDQNDDGTLSSEEVQTATYVCNGAKGVAGPKSGCASAPAGWFALLGLLFFRRRDRCAMLSG